MKNIYHITRDTGSHTMEEPYAFIVVAANEDEARLLCSQEECLYRGDIMWWLSSRTSIVTIVGYTGEQPSHVVQTSWG